MLYNVCTKCQIICPLGRIDSYKLKAVQDSKVRIQQTAFQEALDQEIEYQQYTIVSQRPPRPPKGHPMP